MHACVQRAQAVTLAAEALSQQHVVLPPLNLGKLNLDACRASLKALNLQQAHSAAAVAEQHPAHDAATGGQAHSPVSIGPKGA